MTTPNLQVRRATIDDLPTLKGLWDTEGLSADVLHKRFKEFQVVEGEAGDVRGTLGLHIVGREGCLHSEAFAHPEEADEMRELLLKRMQTLMNNHGLVGVWTQLATPFWHRNGFLQAPDDLLARRPADFLDSGGPWLHLKLKEESAGGSGADFSLDKEFALFRETERQRTEQLYRQARTLKLIATVIATAVLVLILVLLTLFFLKRAQQRRNPLLEGAIRPHDMSCAPSARWLRG